MCIRDSYPIANRQVKVDDYAVEMAADMLIMITAIVEAEQMDADVSNVKCLTFANADVAEFTVPEGAKITKHLIKIIDLQNIIFRIKLTYCIPVSYTHLIPMRISITEILFCFYNSSYHY